ncbi:MAG: SRPBCC family protein [Anaerolineae bacterium]
MKTHHVAASSVIDAPAAQVYAILSDYRVGHPSILPKQYFSALKITRGGVGAGTAIRFQMQAGNSTRSFVADVTEPEPGRVLVESNRLENDPNVTSVTTFTVDSNGERQTRLTIATEMVVSNWLEGVVSTLFLRRVYAQEMKQIAALAEEQSAPQVVHA